MSAVAVKWADGVKGLSRSQWLVLKAVAEAATVDGLCVKTQVKIAAKVRLAERTVREALAQLEGLGLLDRQQKYNARGKKAASLLQLKMQASLPAIPAARTTGNSPKVVLPAIPAAIVYNISIREAGAPETPQNPSSDEIEFSPCTNPVSFGDNVILLAGRAGR
jgi:DNA-binding Lrp family transcriptional regulator